MRPAPCMRDHVVSWVCFSLVPARISSSLPVEKQAVAHREPRKGRHISILSMTKALYLVFPLYKSATIDF
jgi:hypothetical protein